MEAIVRELADPDEREAARTAPSKVEMYRGITVEELSAKWLEAVLELEKREITVTNAEHALEGALSIRYNVWQALKQWRYNVRHHQQWCHLPLIDALYRFENTGSCTLEDCCAPFSRKTLLSAFRMV